MTVVDVWTGADASALRTALRLTSEAFAEHLGVAVRTVANWEAQSEMVMAPRTQEILDVALERASPGARHRFTLLRGGSGSHADEAAAFTVSLAVIVRSADVLLVCRRDGSKAGITWQFPAGVVKPGDDPAAVAVRETLAETGVHCAVRQKLGRRLHPVTGVYCNYFHCDYLAGEPTNLDVIENSSVMWVRRSSIARFIPEDKLYAPVLRLLRENDEAAAS